MTVTVVNGNTGKKYKISDFKFAEGIAKSMREMSEVCVAKRPKTGGKNPRRGVFIVIEGGEKC